MGADTKPEISIKEFVELILQTEVPEAKEWVVKFLTPLPSWDSYGSMPVTESSVECIAMGISAQISKQIRAVFATGLEGYVKLSEHGHRLLREIYQKATDLGLKLDVDSIDYILEPRMPPGP